MKLHIQNLHIHLPSVVAFPARAGVKSMTGTSAAAANAAQCESITLPRLGQLWEEQRGIFLGLMPGENGGRDYALILPVSKDADLGKRAWGERGKDIPLAASQTDGYANTQAMAQAGNALASEVLGMTVDGFSDLYIPARHEARLAYLVAANHFDKDSWHLTSTQSSPDDAWVQLVADGNHYTGSKVYEGVVRLVRRSFI